MHNHNIIPVPVLPTFAFCLASSSLMLQKPQQITQQLMYSKDTQHLMITFNCTWCAIHISIRNHRTVHQKSSMLPSDNFIGEGICAGGFFQGQRVRNFVCLLSGCWQPIQNELWWVEQSIYLSIYLSIHLSINSYLYPNLYIYINIYIYIYTCIHPCI